MLYLSLSACICLCLYRSYPQYSISYLSILCCISVMYTLYPYRLSILSSRSNTLEWFFRPGCAVATHQPAGHIERGGLRPATIIAWRQGTQRILDPEGLVHMTCLQLANLFASNICLGRRRAFLEHEQPNYTVKQVAVII